MLSTRDTISAVTTSRSCSVDDGAFVGPCHRIGPGAITGKRRGHIGDQRDGAAVDEHQQFFANQAGIGHVNVFWQCHNCLLARPLNWVHVIKHDG